MLPAFKVLYRFVLILGLLVWFSKELTCPIETLHTQSTKQYCFVKCLSNIFYIFLGYTQQILMTRSGFETAISVRLKTVRH